MVEDSVTMVDVFLISPFQPLPNILFEHELLL